MTTGFLVQLGLLCFMDMGIFYVCTGKKSLMNSPSLHIYIYIYIFFLCLLSDNLISTESVLYCDFSFNATSREFFLASTIGLFLWIGCPSIPHSCYKLIFMSFYRLITFNNSPVPQIFGFLFFNLFYVLEPTIKFFLL